MVTTISISDKLWEALLKLKDRDNKSFEEVLWKLIKLKEEVSKETENPLLSKNNGSKKNGNK